LKNVPSIDDLSPFKELLSQKLTSAILDSKQHFVESGHRQDIPGFFAKHVRSELQTSLEPYSDEYGFSIDTSNGSFLIYYRGYIIRLYKAYNGRMPAPSRERKTLWRFFNHNGSSVSRPQLPGFESQSSISLGAKIHLIAYYDVDSKLELIWLRIAFPLRVMPSGIDCLWDDSVDPSGSGETPPSTTTKSETPRPDLAYPLLEDGDIFVDDDSLEDGLFQDQA
jgi:hypothetical protein